MRNAIAAGFLAMASFALIAADTTSHSTVTIQASVVSDCAVQSPQSIDFGTYDPATSSTIDVTGNALQVTCTKGATGVTIGLDNGQYYSGGHRAMRSSGGSGAVYYEIYTTVSHSVIWNRTQMVTYAPISRQPVRIPLYARVLGAASPAPGDYSDTLMALLNF